MEKIQWIRQIPLFTNLRVQELISLVSVMAVQRYSKNDLVIREGMPYDCLYLIFEGQVSLITGHETDGQKVLECISEKPILQRISPYRR